GYRFRAAGRSGASTIDLPRSARFLIVPDTAVAALLDPSTLATERRPLADGSHVTVASVRGGGILELAAHEGHVHIRARRPMTPGPVEPRRVRVLAARSMSQITGAEAPYPTHSQWDVYGTDLGSVFWHRDRLYMVFGDSFGAGSRYEGRNWRSNVMA